MRTKTIKEVCAYAQELWAQGMKVDWNFDEKMLDFIGEESCKVLNNDVYLDDNFDYIATIDFNANYSHLEAKCYNYDKYSEWTKSWNKWYWEHGRDMDDKTPCPEEIQEEFTVVVPDTRGFSDTSKRSDTRLYDLDIRCAVDEAVSKHLNKGKVYPWMLKQFVCADEFGLTEEEFDIELEAVCKTA